MRLMEESEDRPPNELVSADYTDLRNYMPDLSFKNLNSGMNKRNNKDFRTIEHKNNLL